MTVEGNSNLKQKVDFAMDIIFNGEWKVSLHQYQHQEEQSYKQQEQHQKKQQVKAYETVWYIKLTYLFSWLF